jgi:hypothetical protein
VSGAQWSPERLINLAHILEEPHMDPRVDGFANRAADALRAFARVVSVLEHAPVKVLRYGVAWEAFAVEPGYRQFGDTPLAAILALADAFDAGRGDDA